MSRTPFTNPSRRLPDRASRQPSLLPVLFRRLRDALTGLHIAWTIGFLVLAIVCAELSVKYASLAAGMIFFLAMAVAGVGLAQNLAERREASEISRGATAADLAELCRMLDGEDPRARRVARRALRRLTRGNRAPSK